MWPRPTQPIDGRREVFVGCPDVYLRDSEIGSGRSGYFSDSEPVWVQPGPVRQDRAQEGGHRPSDRDLFPSREAQQETAGRAQRRLQREMGYQIEEDELGIEQGRHGEAEKPNARHQQDQTIQH